MSERSDRIEVSVDSTSRRYRDAKVVVRPRLLCRSFPRTSIVNPTSLVFFASPRQSNLLQGHCSDSSIPRIAAPIETIERKGRWSCLRFHPEPFSLANIWATSTLLRSRDPDAFAVIPEVGDSTVAWNPGRK